MRPIVTCEFLLGPAYCDPYLINDFVLDLLQIHADVTQSDKPPLLEDDAYTKLVASNRFPTDKVFAKNITEEDGASVYSANDITTLVNKILSTTQSMEDNDYCWITEWQDLSFNPEFKLKELPNRDSELSELLSNIAIFNITQHTEVCALHHHDLNARSTELNGTLLEAYPTDLKFPLAISLELQVHSRYKAYLSNVSPSHFFSQNMSLHDLKLGVYARALRIVREGGRNLSSIDWADFSFGAGFVDSLAKTQSSFNQKYFETLIDCLAHIIAAVPKYQLSPFCVKAGSEEQIKRGHNLAFRSHITKGGAALRLMHWKTKNNRIIFANVGTKGELVIL